ncbi:MAG TPA: PucR family transcriptional regulator ligand-binding domain-containing protein [Conexibacter sp.]|jgi:purine catabolism regulator
MAAAFETGVTVRSVLSLPALRRGVPEVLAGAEQLDREIRWAHTAEVANIATLLEGDELLLTTGMGIGKRATEQAALARALARRRVAGLVLELGNVFATAPPALVAACEKHALPLIALHRQVPFVAITEAIHAQLVNGQFALMQRGEELHRRFTDLMLDGAGVPEVLDALADEAGNPVVFARGGDTRRATAAAHGLNGDVDVDRGAASGSVGGAVIYRAAHDMKPADVAAAWDAYELGLPGAPEAIERPVVGGQGNQATGRLVVLAVERPLGRFDAVAVERAIPLVSLALLHDRSADATAHRERGDFLAALLSGSLDERDAASRAQSFGFAAPTLVPVAIGRRAARIGRLTTEEDVRWARVWHDLRRELDERRTPALLGGDHEHGLLVIGIADPGLRAEAADRIAATLGQIVARHLGGARSAIVCIGRASGTWSELSRDLRGALELLPAAAQARERPWHDVADPDVDRLLWSLRDRQELRDFVDARLGAVIDHDRRRAATLLPTLEALCAHGGRKAATARALHLERPSLYHRIARLERLLGASLSDEDTLLGIHLALRARRQLEG